MALSQPIPARPETVRERVAYIVSLMETLEFERGSTIYDIAIAWELAESTVGGYAAEASRQVTGDEHEARRDITAACRAVLKEAARTKNARDVRAVGELLAKVSGAMAPEKTEHRVTGVSLDDISELRKTTGAAALQGRVPAQESDCLPTENSRESGRNS